MLARGAQLSYLSLAGSEMPGLYAGGVRIGDSLFLNDGSPLPTTMLMRRFGLQARASVVCSTVAVRD